MNDRRLVAQLFSALRSAAGQDLAAVRGRHSLAEAMLFLALALLGLIGTEHRHNSFLNHTQQHPVRDTVVGNEIPPKSDGIECVLYL